MALRYLFDEHLRGQLSSTSSHTTIKRLFLSMLSGSVIHSTCRSPRGMRISSRGPRTPDG